MFSNQKIFLAVAVACLAVAAGGCSSGSSSTTPDTAPPAVPTDLSATYASGVVKVAWSPNLLDADFDGFKIYRRVGQDQVPLVSNPTSVTYYVDQNPSPGYIEYLVTAVDQVGNESAYATVGLEVGEGLPRSPYTY